MYPKLGLAAITDEFSSDLHIALSAMAAIGMNGSEFRVLYGKNVIELSDDELKRAAALASARGMPVVSIASPLLKCVLPGDHEIDARYQQDVFGSQRTFDDQPRLAERAFAICRLTGAKILRVFSYWRTTKPEVTHDAVAEALTNLAQTAQQEGITIGLENEFACNIATAAESALMLKRVDHPNLKLIWDPANALVAGETPFPDGYQKLPKERIVHVHAKDCHMEESGKPIWGPLGTRHVDWKGQIRALLDDGYTGAVSLETHWPGPDGDKLKASTICGWNLRGLLTA